MVHERRQPRRRPTARRVARLARQLSAGPAPTTLAAGRGEASGASAERWRQDQDQGDRRPAGGGEQGIARHLQGGEAS
eukprot:13972647-Alexandrium_andersonii.AAC.1